MIISGENTIFIMDEESLAFSIHTAQSSWTSKEDFHPYLETSLGNFSFLHAESISHKAYKSGVGDGIISTYKNFKINGQTLPYAFKTLIWIEYATEHLYFEWIPLIEEGFTVQNVYWPAPFEFSRESGAWYSLINLQQGLMIPNTWKTDFTPDSFHGRFCTSSGYMPWFAQVKDRSGYLAISLTPWNSGYEFEHNMASSSASLSFRLESSLGKMSYHRIMRYSFLEDCDYNDICKAYRNYTKENGNLKTLKEKIIKTPSIKKLIGCFFVHLGIKTSIQPESDFYNFEFPEKNNRVVSFSQREREIKNLHSIGIKKLYLHLDGWGDYGYDNRHPDPLPICEEAGGTEGMKSLSDTIEELGFLFGIHDQYRDFYKDAPSYDEEFACLDHEGNIFSHQRWAGGPQSYLCTTQAPYYVKRNFKELENLGIHPDCAYLDVFTCNEGDECSNPNHKMTRKDSYELRNKCFEFLLSKNIIPSSEEVNDWAIPSLVFCHYAPYDFMLKKPGTPKLGIPVPLFNLVYHDCVIIPWMMEKYEEEDYMLYALINGGLPYLIRDAAYPNIDGAFSKGMSLSLKEHLYRSKAVADLHRMVADSELVRHELLDETGRIQTSIFANGIQVTVNFDTASYEITKSNSKPS